MPHIVGEMSHPVVAVIGSYPDGVVELLESMDATVATLASRDDPAQYVDLSEYDAVLVFGWARHYPEHLFVLHVGDSAMRFSNRNVTANLLGETLARELVPVEPSSPLSQLSVSLANFLTTKIPRTVLTLDGKQESADLTPLVSTRKGEVCAGYFQRAGNESEWIWLPADTPQILDWVRAIFKRWNEIAPDRFPIVSDWRANEEWMTAPERQAFTNLKEHMIETTKILNNRKLRQEELTKELEALQNEAENGPRRLLETNGDDLKQEVITCLQSLGFNVTDSDTLIHQKGQLFEDLEITTDSWTAIVEVKGYEKRNARTSDLQSLYRAEISYIKRNPSKQLNAKWYIINQSFATSPDEREQPFASATEDLDQFADADGLVIDTRDLFRLSRDVQAGEITDIQAREKLTNTSRLFQYPN